MTGRVFVQVRCDAEPDGPQAPPCMTPAAVPDVTTLAALRTQLRSNGWHHTNRGRDICPMCWADGHR